MKRILLVVFLLAVSGIAFSQTYEWLNVGLVEDAGEVLGWAGVFRNDFMITENGTIIVMTKFYSYDRRSACLLEISILQKGKETISFGWSEPVFDLIVTVASPEAYDFPDGIDKKSFITFYYYFPKEVINFYEPFTIKYETVFDTTWHTYDMSKTQPAEREYWRRNKRL